MATALVTGVSRSLSARFARSLAESGEMDLVVGTDARSPRFDLGPVRFARVDRNNVALSRLLAEFEVDTVVHMDVSDGPLPGAAPGAGARSSQKELNVLGTMQLLAACQRSDRLHRLVVRSSAAVYGSSPRDPALFREDTPAKVAPRDGYGRDAVEVEGYVRGFSRRRPDVAVAILRLADVLGSAEATSVTDYLSLPVVPTVLGFDPRVQFLGQADALRALRIAALGEATGPINVAGPGVVTLCQAVALTGRRFLPVPAAALPLVGRALRGAGWAAMPRSQVRYLTFGRALDLTRMRTELGFTPERTTRQALEHWAAGDDLPPAVGVDMARRTLRHFGVIGDD